MGMEIDQTRTYILPCRINDLGRGLHRQRSTDGGNPAIQNPDIGIFQFEFIHSVNQGAMLNHSVKG